MGWDIWKIRVRKSTLVDIILGLLAPNKGSMFIDNTKITYRNVENWQLNIAHVPQTIFLADNTITENVSFGSKRKTDLKKVKIAAQKAKISNSINKMKKNMELILVKKELKYQVDKDKELQLQELFIRIQK